MDRYFYGAVQYCGDSIDWPLADMAGRPDVIVKNFCLDPTGEYVIQTPIYAPINCPPLAWTFPAAGNAAAKWTLGTDEGTRKQFIKQSNGGYGTQFDATFDFETRDQDTGFVVNMFRGGAIAPSADKTPVASSESSDHALYLEFSAYQQVNLRLCVEKGAPIRLESTADGGKTWVTAATADSLGESESYLAGKKRALNVLVMPLCDGNYYANASQGLDQTFSPYQQGVFTCDPPPSKVVVSINDGDAVLEYKADQCSLSPGAIRISGTGGQWTCRYSRLLYQANCSMSLPKQTRPRQFQTEAQGSVIGYVPPANSCDVAANVSSLHMASATVTASGPATPTVLPPAQLVQSTPKTCVISTARLDFPPAFLGKQVGLDYLLLQNDSIVEWSHTHDFDQENFFGVTQGKVLISDPESILAPGSQYLPLSVQACQLVAGLADPSIDYDDGQIVLTGLTGVRPKSMEWEWRNGQQFLSLALGSRLRMHVPVAFVPVMDGQCHYYAMRQLGYRLGFIDEDMNFPICTRDSACPHYHLPTGTTFDPLFRFPPNMTVVEAMLQVRRVSGEIDAATDMVVPMFLYVDPMGVLQYFGAPAGLVSAWLDPTLSLAQQGIEPWKIYSAVPNFTEGYPDLNEFLRAGPLASSSTLDNIRAPIIMQGLRQTDGAYLEGWNSNEALIDQPGTPGYVGLPVPYVETSRLFSSEGAIGMSLAVASVQMSFPSIESQFTGHYQSGLGALAVIGVQDFATQGTTDPVPYYTTHVESFGANDGTAYTNCSARLLGQA